MTRRFDRQAGGEPRRGGKLGAQAGWREVLIIP
jgi:hypothetical protein